MSRASFKIVLTQIFPLCGATCYIVVFKDDVSASMVLIFVYRSVEVDRLFGSYLRVLVRIRNFYNG